MSFRDRETERDHVNFVGIGYNDACTDFVVTFRRGQFHELKQAIKNVGDYNYFNGERIVQEFQKIEHLVLSAKFGREGSPVLYLTVEREDDGTNLGRPIAVSEVMSQFSKMRSKSKPDEINVDFYDAATIRFWWD